MDVLVPPHENSNKTSPDIVCLTEIPAPAESPLAGFAAVGVDILIGQVAKGLEKESKRYKTTYSARTANHLFRLRKTSTSAEFSLNKHLKSIWITRRYGKTVPKYTCDPIPLDHEENAPEDTLFFEAQIIYSDARDAIKLKPTSFEFTSSKAKVAKGAIWYLPWTWWMIFDSSTGKVDLNIQIEMTLFGTRNSTTAIIDFPIGKIDLDKGIHNTDAWLLDQIESGWISIPKINLTQLYNPKDMLEVMPMNFKVTIMEANDLGDVIAKGGTKLSENKDKILEFLKDE